METTEKSRESGVEAASARERRRVIIEGVRPQVDCGRFAAKRELGEDVVVEADVFTDGHDAVACRLLFRPDGVRTWRAVPMQPLPNDRWRASFRAERLGRWIFTLQGWVDAFATWRGDLEKRVAAGHDVTIDLLIGADILERTAGRATPQDRRSLAGSHVIRYDYQ